MTVLPEPYEILVCPVCREEVPSDTTWCFNFGKGHVPITPVRVRWTPEVVDAEAT